MARSAHKRADIVARLRAAILSSDLPPGVRLPEIRLARQLGVSQAVIREALSDLEALGLVVRRPGVGSSVVELSSDDLLQIYAVRAELEALAASLLTAAGSASATEALAGCVAAMRAAGAASDFGAYSDADIAFHRALWSHQPNRMLERTLETLCLPLFAFDRLRRTPLTGDTSVRVARQHELVLLAIRSGDPDLASRVMRRMMRRWLRTHLTEYSRLAPLSAPDADPLAALNRLI